MSRWLVILSVAFLGNGCDREVNALGRPLEGSMASVAEIQGTNLNALVQLRGTMVKKCPTAGCWFILQDQTGTIKVDTKSSGFVVVDIPLNSSLLVAGRVATNGSERMIDATGLRRAEAH